MSATLSILAYPQRWVNNKLSLRVLVMPRNIDPNQADEITPNSPAWVDAETRIAFDVHLTANADDYPNLALPALTTIINSVNEVVPAESKTLLNWMAAQLGGIKSTKKLDDEGLKNRTRKKLPESYIKSFNFTAPRTADADMGDGYRCAIRDKVDIDPAFKSGTDSLSWGKVFAHCLRQPALAKIAGFIYELDCDLPDTVFQNATWLYVNLSPGCSYEPGMTLNQKLVKRYAVRIPKLKKDDDRGLFAVNHFPVLINAAPNMADFDDPVTPTNFDELLIEAAQYDDGFCKIVHANQPVSGDLLLEKEDKELPVITDAGIRLGWEDEQLLIWMNRQMAQDPLLPAGRRTDAPLGVMQYRVDARKHSDDPNALNPWISLNKVSNNAILQAGDVVVQNAHTNLELGFEVYPTQLDHRKDQPFWLPQYFSNWIGNSLVLQDEDAIRIFRKNENTRDNQPVSGSSIYSAVGLEEIPLRYGNKYDFRVRLVDTTGGGPSIEMNHLYGAPCPEAFCDFRRYVQPQAMRLLNEDLPKNDEDFFSGDSISLQRPLLGYPAVIFTGGYADPITSLANDVDAATLENRVVGLADPDVDSVEILVEVKALEMDMLLRADSDSRESYAKLYYAKRTLIAADLNAINNIAISWVDAPVISFSDSTDLGILGLIPGGNDINDRADIVLPTGRDLRITLRAAVTNRVEYYAPTSLVQRGKPFSILARKASNVEMNLFKPTAITDRIKGVWLLPDTDNYLKARLDQLLVENYEPGNASGIMQRLADAIDRSIEVEAKGLSLVGKTGYRLQFGVSRFIRHNMSPDATNITFSTKTDLLNHWIVPITLLLNRDWTWDALQPVSFDVYRKKKMAGAGLTEDQRAAIAWDAEELIGDIELKKTINIQALYNPDRSQTYLCFIDAVDPKTADIINHPYPEELMVEYRIHANFNNPVETDADEVLTLHLPITTKPAQVPRIVSAGIAQSKYVNNETYSSTEPRQRFLWVEFDKPLSNPNDAYFIRNLAYSPDPLLARWEPEMLKAPEEASLAINPEPIRIISPGHTDDKSGLNAMQEMTASTDISPVHYIAPLPPGLHSASPELFGFFTYELRVGHKKGWSTAQGRFGSALRTSGVQHPAPQLFCIAERNEKRIMVTAPFAQTVFDGRDVTSNPPRTQLWALLYAQVKRADDDAFRNVLLDDQLLIRRRRTFGADSTGKPFVDINTDAKQYGITGWKNQQVLEILFNMGLPLDSNLSVLVVEMMPTYEKFVSPKTLRNDNSNLMLHNNFRGAELRQNFAREMDGMQVEYFRTALESQITAASDKQKELEKARQDRMQDEIIAEAEKGETIRPLATQLGKERILRTSTLVPVPPICCPE